MYLVNAHVKHLSNCESTRLRAKWRKHNISLQPERLEKSLALAALDDPTFAHEDCFSMLQHIFFSIISMERLLALACWSAGSMLHCGRLQNVLAYSLLEGDCM
jgi:hypothetical protein